jgi:hypothetical protein
VCRVWRGMVRCGHCGVRCGFALRRVTLCLAVPCRAVSCRASAMSCRVVWRVVCCVSCGVMRCRVVSCAVPWCGVVCLACDLLTEGAERSEACAFPKGTLPPPSTCGIHPWFLLYRRLRMGYPTCGCCESHQWAEQPAHGMMVYCIVCGGAGWGRLSDQIG